MEGCPEMGHYKAPKSRDELGSYQWFCLEHAREHNSKWDFLAGYDSEAIERFIRDAQLGHRPTWSRDGIRYTPQKLQDALYEFLEMGTRRPSRPSPPLSAKLRKALSALDMEYPYTPGELKVQYRALVKKHHPDVNKGDKKSEEIFKKVTSAYHVLVEHLKTL